MNNLKTSLCFSGHRTDKLPKKENIILKLKNIYYMVLIHFILVVVMDLILCVQK